MKSKRILLEILKLLKPFKARLIIAGISLVTIVSCLLAIGWLVKNLVDTNIHHDKTPLYLIPLIILFGIGSFLRSYIINSTSELAADIIRKKAFISVLSLRTSQLETYSFSDIASRINSDVDYIARVIIDITSFFVRNSFTTIGGIIFMFINSIKLSLISFGSILIITLFTTKFSKYVKMLARNAEEAKSTTSNLVLESIINNKVISAFCSEDRVLQYYENLNSIRLEKINDRLKFRALFFASSIVAILLTVSFLIWYGNLEVAKNNLTTGTLASFLFYALMTAMSFGGIIEMLNELEKNLVNCERVFELIQAEEKATQKIDIESADFIELSNIYYNYKESEKEILSNLNIKIETNKFTVLTGESGKGKTTILNLLMGLYQAKSGQIIIGSQKYEKIFPEYWNQKLSYVPQDNMLFSGSILDNITFFSSSPNLEKIKYITEGLDLSRFINNLPKGLFSNVGNLASKISGGQKQRIAIARALYFDPEIVILDEATSQLDEPTEFKVINFIKTYLKNKTIICVAHRRGAIELADQVIPFEK